MIKLCVTVALLYASATSFAQSSPQNAGRPELERTGIARGHTLAEISGFAIDPRGKLLTVTDEPTDHFIHEVQLRISKKRFDMKSDLDLSKLSGWDEYTKESSNQSFLSDPTRTLDLEAIAVCGDTVYLANERVRQIIAIDRTARQIRRLAIDWSAHPEFFKGGDNAGIEGFAADCVSRIGYVVKERQPRMIYAVSLDSGKIVWSRDIPTSDRCCQRVVEWTSGNGLVTLEPDFADVVFQNGFLYLLERNMWEITKVDVAHWKVVSRVSYFKTEKDLYTTGEPFGLAEALALTNEEVFIGFDNNTAPFSPQAEFHLGLKGRQGAIAIFKRPAGF